MEYKKGDKIKKKKGLFGLNKKQVVSIGVTGIVAFAVILGGTIFMIQLSNDEEIHFICGFGIYPESLDPIRSSTPTDSRVYDQVAEALFEYDQSRKNCPIIPCLAEDNGTWSADFMNFTCSLRKGVKFHDGTVFNATAVKWNFDRINRLLYNMSWPYMYINNEGERIINTTEIIGEYTIKFVLNKPYVPLKALLSVWHSYILSPTSTPENDFINAETGKLVGTGPFIMDSCILTPEKYIDKITFKANPYYWGGKPQISKLTFIQLSSEERLAGLLSGELSYADGNHWYQDYYQNTPGITLIMKLSPVIWYIALNNNLFPIEMRKAISYAFNYSNFYGGDLGERVRSPLSRGLLYSNWGDYDLPEYDITIARQTLIDASWPNTTGLTANDNISVGNEWEQLVTDGNPLATYNFTVVSTNDFHWFLFDFFSRDLKQIGVKIEPNPITQGDYWVKVLTGELEFYYSGWGPSFNDPVEEINPLFSNRSDGLHNDLNFYDEDIQHWMDDALEEFNETKRAELYYNIQRKLIEELYPKIWLYSFQDFYVWASNVKGIPHEEPYFKFILKYAYFEK